MFWKITYYCIASLLAIGGAALTLVFIVPLGESNRPAHNSDNAPGWWGILERNRIRFIGFALWLVGVGMIVYALYLEGI